MTALCLYDIAKIEVSSSCLESFPCKHSSTVTLKDGRSASCGNSYQIWALVSQVAQEKINPGQTWEAEAVKKHFAGYSTPILRWKVETFEVVINRIFANK